MAGTNGTTVQHLTGTNNYTGNTTITSGTLSLHDGGQLYNGVSPGTTTINTGTLSGGLNGATINGPVQLASGKIAPDIGGILTMNSLTTTGGSLPTFLIATA